MAVEEIAVHYDDNNGHAWVECDREGFLRYRNLLRDELNLSEAQLDSVIGIEIIDMSAGARHFGKSSLQTEIVKTLVLIAVIVVLIFAVLGVRSVTGWF